MFSLCERLGVLEEVKKIRNSWDGNPVRDLPLKKQFRICFVESRLRFSFVLHVCSVRVYIVEEGKKGLKIGVLPI